MRKIYPSRNLTQALSLDVQSEALSQYDLDRALLKSPLRYLASSAPTIGDALVAVIRYMCSRASAIYYRLENGPKQAVLYSHSSLPANAEIAKFIEKSILAIGLLISEIGGFTFTPRAVTLKHAPLGDMLGYQSHFNCPISFEQEHNTQILSLEVLRTPCAGYDAELHSMLRFFLEVQNDNTDSLASQVKRKIQLLLPTHRATLELVAQSLNLHPRTLQRRLAQEGVDFEEFLDTIRRNQAEHMLHKTSLSISQITSELGYRRTTSFCRAHQRWFDMTPRQHRTQLGDPLITSIYQDHKATSDA